MNTIQGAILGFIIAAFLMLGGIIFLQHHKIALDEARYDDLLKNSSALQAENVSWKLAAAQQNAKIAQLASARAARDAKAARAHAALAAAAKRYTGFAGIHARQVSADDCDGARVIESFYLRDRP